MKKYLFLMLIMFSMVFSANAQYVNNTFDNISVGINAGSVAPVKPGKGFWEAQRPNFGLEVTKQVNPVVALAVEGETNVNTTPSRTAFDQAAVYGLGKWNLSNLLFGYHGCPRLFEVEAVTGAGWGHNYFAGANGSDALLSKLGLNFNLNLGETDTWTIGLKPALVYDLSGNKFTSNRLVSELRAGVTYHFKNQDGNRYITRVRVYDEGEVASLNATINDLRAELAKKPKEVIVEKQVPVYVTRDFVVMFAQNSDVLTDDAKKVLDAVKEGSNVKVTATASPEGGDEYNKILSQKRANVVKEYLEGRGVQVLEADGLGVVGEASNRVAIVVVQ